MDYTEVFNQIKKASLFDLYRLNVSIRNEMENPERIKQLRQAFKEGDTVTYFDQKTNALISAIIIQKNLKYVQVKKLEDQAVWNIPYYLLNIDNVNVDIHAYKNEKLSRNHLKVGDCVGFNHDGQPIFGAIIRLNPKTVTLITPKHQRWRAYYHSLFRVIDSSAQPFFNPQQLAQWVEEEKTQRIHHDKCIQNAKNRP